MSTKVGLKSCRKYPGNDFGKRNSIATHLVLLRATSSKEPNQDEIWQDYSSRKYAAINRVRLSHWHHYLNTAAMASFHAEKCRRVASKHEATERASMQQCIAVPDP